MSASIPTPEAFHDKADELRAAVAGGSLEFITSADYVDLIRRDAPFPEDAVWILAACSRCGQMFSLGGVVYKWHGVAWGPYPR